MASLKRYGRLIFWFIPAIAAFYNALLACGHYRPIEIRVPFKPTQLVSGMSATGVCISYATVVAEAEITPRCAETLLVGITVHPTSYQERVPFTLHVTRNTLPVTVVPLTSSGYGEDISARCGGRFKAYANQTYRVQLALENVSPQFPNAFARMTVTRAPEAVSRHALPIVGLYLLGLLFLAVGIIQGIQIRYQEMRRHRPTMLK